MTQFVGDGKTYPARRLGHVVKYIAVPATADRETIANRALSCQPQGTDYLLPRLITPQCHAIGPADPRHFHWQFLRVGVQ